MIVPHTPSSEIAIERFELAETLSPGGMASAYLLLWDAFQKDFVRTTMTATIYDAARSVNHGDNFGLTGEHFAARYHPDSGRYECVGSRGLFRLAKADSAIASGGVGTCTIWTGDPLSNAGISVDVDNSWSNVDIGLAAEVMLRYVKGVGVWVPVVSSGGTTLWQFSLNENMGATTSNQAAADLLDMDGVDTGSDVTVKDPIQAFSGLVNGDIGLCLEQGGEYFVIQAPC